MDATMNDWPGSSDSFFRDDFSDWQHNAVLGVAWFADDEISKWETHVAAYGDAAKAVASSLIGGGLPADLAAYPVIFLFVHHFEIAMKAIIKLAARFLEKDVPIPKSHDLLQLWSVASPVIVELEEAVGEEGTDEASRDTKRLFEELASSGVNSTSIRYPEGLTGEDNIPNLKRFNVRHFAATASKVSNYLSCLGTWIWVLLQTKWDMESEYR